MCYGRPTLGRTHHHAPYPPGKNRGGYSYTTRYLNQFWGVWINVINFYLRARLTVYPKSFIDKCLFSMVRLSETVNKLLW